MKQAIQATDDRSFRSYLNKINLEDLKRHAEETILSDAMIEFILNHKHLQDSCYKILLKQSKQALNSNLQKSLETALESLNEYELKKMIGQILPKTMIIDLLLEYTDEDARIDIMDSQNDWDKNNSNMVS